MRRMIEGEEGLTEGLDEDTIAQPEGEGKKEETMEVTNGREND